VLRAAQMLCSSINLPAAVAEMSAPLWVVQVNAARVGLLSTP